MMLIRLEHKDIIVHETKVAEISGELIIGRGHDCNWVVPKEDRLTSSKHAALIRKGRGAVIKDLQSSNGIFFRGKKIDKKKLSAGDRISIGDCMLCVEEDTGVMGRELSAVRVLTGKTHGAKKDLVPPRFTIGSDPASNLVFMDLLVSRHHAEISIKEDGSCWIRDLGSKNGTSVNGVPLRDTERMLKDRDKIAIAHLEFVFQDGAVKRVNSQVWLRIGILLLTLIVTTGLYWTYKRLKPSADHYIRQTEKLAAVENFADAKAVLSKSIGARNYSAREQEATELRRMIEIWEQTLASWRQTQHALKEGNWVDASRNLGMLAAARKEAWAWNKKAISEKDAAIRAKTMLDALSRSTGALKREDITVADLKKEQATLNNLLAEESPADYLDKLREEMGAAQRDIEKILQETSGLELALDQLNLPAPPYPQVVQAIEQIQKTAGVSARRRAGIVLEPIKSLTASFEALNQAADLVRELKFNTAINTKLNLPTVDACAIDPRISYARSQIEGVFESLKRTAGQLAFLYGEIEKRIERPDAIPATFKNWRDEAVMEKCFACDVLDLSLPKRTRAEPTGEYDRVLGVEEFFNFLNTLPNPVDPSYLQELPFLSVLTKSKEIVNRIEKFKQYLDQPDTQWLKAGKLAVTINQLDQILAERDAVVQLLFAKGQELTGRQALIGIGIAVGLAEKPEELEIDGTDAKSWLVAELKKLKDQVSKLNSEYNLAAPARQIEIRDEVMRLGLPGDPSVRRMWSIRDASKAK